MRGERAFDAAKSEYWDCSFRQVHCWRTREPLECLGKLRIRAPHLQGKVGALARPSLRKMKTVLPPGNDVPLYSRVATDPGIPKIGADFGNHRLGCSEELLSIAPYPLV